jgi:hypothetical protein
MILAGAPGTAFFGRRPHNVRFSNRVRRKRRNVQKMLP